MASAGFLRRKTSHSNIGNLIRSSFGTISTGWPAFRQALKPPEITNTLKPSLISVCATRALVASRAQVQ